MITTAFDRGYASGQVAGAYGSKPKNPYWAQRQFNAWEYGFHHAQLDARVTLESRLA